jgi:predicted phage replisome organizer
MAEVKWIKIVTDVFDDEKILMIETMPEADTIIVIWFKLLCLAGKQNNSGVFQMGQMPYTDEMFSTIFRRPLNTVRLALKTFEQFGMVEIINNTVTIPNWEKHQSLDAYEQAKEKIRMRVAAHRERQKALTGCSVTGSVTGDVTVTVCNAIDKIREDENRGDKKKETTHDLLQRLLPDYAMSMTQHKAVAEKLSEWIKYKTERKEPYKEQGMKSLLRQIENNCFTYGDQAVCDLIDDSMANGWKGIIFDRLKQRGKPTSRKGGNVFLEIAQEEGIV